MTARTLVAARGLTLTLEAAPHWRIGWETPDWLGPIGIAAHHDTTEYVGGSPRLAAGAANGAHTRRLDPAFETFDGNDDLGRYEGLAITWQPLPWPLRTTARAYRDTALLVFGIEATAAA